MQKLGLELHLTSKNAEKSHAACLIKASSIGGFAYKRCSTAM
jgi:hypothetical protein